MKINNEIWCISNIIRTWIYFRFSQLKLANHNSPQLGFTNQFQLQWQSKDWWALLHNRLLLNLPGSSAYIFSSWQKLKRSLEIAETRVYDYANSFEEESTRQKIMLELAIKNFGWSSLQPWIASCLSIIQITEEWSIETCAVTVSCHLTYKYRQNVSSCYSDSIS